MLGNAVFWILLAALSVSADAWYWWPIVPLAAFATVLGLHLRHGARGPA